MPALDRDGPVPLYEQLAAILRARIASGEIPAGRRLPSKPTLEQEYDVSQKTVERTFQVLAEEGLTERVPGKGHFVVDPARRK